MIVWDADRNWMLNEYDYTYNFTMVQSLILSQAKANMEIICRYCKAHDIPMFYSSCDSLYVLSKDVAKLSVFCDVRSLGKMKVEAKNACGAVFIEPGLYYICDTKYSAKYVPHSQIEKYAKARGLSICEVFNELVNGRVSLLSINRF